MHPVSGSHPAAGAASGAHGAGTKGAVGAVNSTTTIHNMEDLRKKAPDVFNKMMEGIGIQMISKLQRDQKRLEQIMKEGERAAQGR